MLFAPPAHLYITMTRHHRRFTILHYFMPIFMIRAWISMPCAFRDLPALPVRPGLLCIALLPALSWPHMAICESWNPDSQPISNMQLFVARVETNYLLFDG